MVDHSICALPVAGVLSLLPDDVVDTCFSETVRGGKVLAFDFL